MNDLRMTIVPKSDQINADDLIGRNMTITVNKVSLLTEADQPVALSFDGDNGKPYKPCKSMRRVLVNVWGPDGNQYIGRSLTLYRDDKVQFGGLAVGGIRISHMSHIDKDVTMALTATRANRKPFTVKPLKVEAPAQQHAAQPKRQTAAEWLDKLEADLQAAQTAEQVDAIINRPDVQKGLQELRSGALTRLQHICQAAEIRTAPPVDDDDAGFPGVATPDEMAAA